MTLTPLLVLLSGACSATSTTDTSGGGTTTVNALTAAQALWAAKKPAGDKYTMVQRVVCTCATLNTAYRLTVVGLTISSVVNDRTDEALPVAQWAVFKTVAQLFAAITAAQANTGQLKSVDYDATLGFPRTLSLDPNVATTGDEISYVTTSVTATP
jgi:hypothetical protein